MNRLFELVIRILDKDLFSTDREVDLIHQLENLRKINNELLEENTNLKKENKTFTLCKFMRGKRYDSIILPDNREQFEEWLHTELIPTLSLDGKIIGNQNFIRTKG